MLPSGITVRPGGAADRPFLEVMLYEAIHWDPAAPRADPEQIRRTPEFLRMLDAWGDRPGDTAQIAEASDGTPVGAAWYRYWTRENHSWGFVEPSVPEIGMGVVVEHRSQGIGRALLVALCETAREDGVRAVSLSVDPANYAKRLYESVGFGRVGASGTSHTLVRKVRA